MRFSAFHFGLLTLLIGLSACSGSSGDSPSNTAPPAGEVESSASHFEGLWIDKEEAEELRATGRVDSLCEEIRKDPNSSVLNVRLIDGDGSVYLYLPEIGKIAELKMGSISPSNEVILTESFKQYVGNMTLRVALASDVLSFIYASRQAEFSVNYVRSSEEEVQKYSKAQKACTP